METAQNTGGQNYRHIRLAHTAAVVAGEIVQASGRVLVALSAAAANVSNIFLIEADIRAPKPTGTVILAGVTLYFDPIAGVFTTAAGTLSKAGYATETALAEAVMVDMFLTNDANL